MGLGIVTHMADKSVFLDTSALLAIANRSDGYHAAAKDVHLALKSRRARLVTSQWVLAEFLNLASRPPLRAAACRIVGRALSSQRTQIVPAATEGWRSAYEFYSQYQDKQWSFVDSTSMLICKELGIAQVFTSDRHFEQFGLEILLP